MSHKGKQGPNDKSMLCTHAKSVQLHSTLLDPMDCSLPGSSVNGILQARILDWVAMPSSKHIMLYVKLKTKTASGRAREYRNMLPQVAKGVK